MPRHKHRVKHVISSVFARAANASTMASKHVLAEFASMHSRAATAWEEAEAIPAADIRFFTPKASSGWHLYLADQRALGINMAEVGSMWHNLTNLRTAMPSDRTRSASETKNASERRRRRTPLPWAQYGEP